MPSDVDDVAAGILAAVGPMTSMKLQKLAYYVQAWHLARHDRPAFDEPIEAWRDGPVVRRLFQQHRTERVVSSWPSGRPEALSGSVRDVMTDVLRRYAALSAEQLSAITHRERPWQQARQDLPEAAPSSQPIDRGAMAAFYRRQGGNAATAVDDAVASARLEGAELSDTQVALLRSVASGAVSADDAVERVLSGGG